MAFAGLFRFHQFIRYNPARVGVNAGFDHFCAVFTRACGAAAGARAITAQAVAETEIHWSCPYGNALSK
jgi:hypothetical protein